MTAPTYLEQFAWAWLVDGDLAPSGDVAVELLTILLYRGPAGR